MAWTDYIANWSSVDRVRLAAPINGIIPVIKAINERCTVAGISTITEVARLDATAVMPLIQNRITYLIKLFVNQTVNGGNFDGLSEIPMWTEADILTSIGATERIAAPTNINELSVNWLYQQYQIINKLVWQNIGDFIHDVEYYGGVGESYAEALADLQPAGGKFRWVETISCYIGDDWSWYDIWITHPDQAKITLPAQSINCTVRNYGFIRVAPESRFDPGSYSFTENSYWSMSEDVEVAAGVETEIDSILHAPPPQDIDYNTGWQCGNGAMLAKFNVPGGFEYVES